MKKHLLAIFLTLTFYNGVGQNLDLEEKAFTCIENVYREQGFEVSSIIEEYEDLLITKKYLNDSSGRSYYALLKQIIDQKELQIDSSASFAGYDKLLKNNDEANKIASSCAQNILITKNGERTKWQQVLEDINRKFQFEVPKDNAWLCELLLKNLSYQDFENQFYKLKAMLAIDLVNEKWGRRHMLPPIPDK